MIGQADTCADGSQPLSWEGAVSDGSQDVETALHFVDASGDSIKLGYVKDLGPQVVFLRFANIEVPPSAEIHSAKVIFTVKQAGAERSEDFKVVVNALRRSKFFPAIESHGSGTATAEQKKEEQEGLFRSFTSLMADGSTAANVTFVPDTNPAEAKSESADLNSVVQEYVRYPGYQIGNAMTLLFGNGPTTQTTQSREYYSFESGGAAKGPRLSITYCLSGMSEASMSDDMGSVQTLQKGKVSGIFGASELHEGLPFQQWHTVPSLGLIFVVLAAMGMLVKLASRRFCSRAVDRQRQSHGCAEWEDGAKETCIE